MTEPARNGVEPSTTVISLVSGVHVAALHHLSLPGTHSRISPETEMCSGWALEGYMKIAQVQVEGVSVPFSRPEVWSMGVRRGVTNIVVRVLTDEGLEGLGEYPALPTPEVALAAGTHLAAQVVGRSVDRIDPLMAHLKVANGWHHFPHFGNLVLAGFEMALWDVLGRMVTLPVYQLFGGAYRTNQPIMYFLPQADPEAMVTEAADAVAQGYGTIYIKVGMNEARDVAVVRGVRAAIGPAIKLRIDANEAWSVKEAIRIGRALLDCDLEFIEQPTPYHDVRSLAEVKQALGIPIAANQSSWSNEETRAVLEQRAADVLLTDPHQAGGLSAFRKAAAAAELFGVPVVRHSFCELGIGLAAAAHVIASTANCTLANQAYTTYISDDIVRNPPEIRRGALTLPDGPGLGVVLDDARFAEARARFQRGEHYPIFTARDVVVQAL